MCDSDNGGMQVIESRVAVLGLLADLHQEPVQYDLKSLRRLVKTIHPDLLCAEIDPEDWEVRDLGRVSPEYRESLVPLARRTDIVVVPVRASSQRDMLLPEKGPFRTLRRFVVRALNRMQRRLLGLARGPQDLNSGKLDLLCDGMCALSMRISGSPARQAWEAANQAMLDNILVAIQRDPGRRVLVTVDCRRRRWLMQKLAGQVGVELVEYHQL